MYFQGGLTFEHAQLAIMGAAEKVLEAQGKI
jgi:cystathionine beta-lyase family protein involved in aluminum resistance